jgi:hypothetical protein
VLGTRSDLGMMSIKKAYDDPKTHRSFTYRAWVKLMHPFNPHKFIRNILAQFHKNSHQVKFSDILEPMDIMVATDGVLIKEFKKQINQKYLVVLEDVSTMVDWESVRVYLPDKNNGSCIVVHTQQLGIGSSCVGHPHRVLKLNKYSADHSVCVIYKVYKNPHLISFLTLSWLPSPNNTIMAKCMYDHYNLSFAKKKIPIFMYNYI